MLNPRMKTSFKIIAILWICIPKSTAKIARKSVPDPTCNFQLEGKNRDYVKMVCSGSGISMGALRQGAERNVAIKLRIPASVIYKLAKQLQDSEPTEPPPPPPVEQLDLPIDNGGVDNPQTQFADQSQDVPNPSPSPPLISRINLPEFQLVLKPTGGSQNTVSQYQNHFAMNLKNEGRLQLNKKVAPKRSGRPRYNKNVRVRAQPNGRATNKLQFKQPQELTFVLTPKLT